MDSSILNDLEKLRDERHKQEQKVTKLTNAVNDGRAKLAKEQTKLESLREKVDSLEYFIFKEKLKNIGIEGEDGIDTLIDVYKKHKEENKGDEE